MDYPWSGVRVWTSRSILHTFYSPVPLDTNGDPPKERDKDDLSESRINDSSRPLRLYNHQRKPSETHYTPPLFSDNLHSEDKEEEGEETEEEDARSRSPIILRAQAVVGALRANFRTGIIKRQLSVSTLFKRRQREHRVSWELNGQHSSLGEPANNPLAHSPTSDPSEDVPLTPRSAGTQVPDSPSPLSITNHHPSSFTFPSRSDSPISRPPSAASSTTIAASHSAGPYHRVNYDTLAKSQTYETLPSYRSRRNTQIFTDLEVPLPRTPRTRIRPLPPLPSQPPFVS
ncbi:hypothetical protein PM082_009282 [Marasmius tenuissimus]|nr:hypothetical protein PM082_009282 [Marasmius tenuissimus]